MSFMRVDSGRVGAYVWAVAGWTAVFGWMSGFVPMPKSEGGHFVVTVFASMVAVSNTISLARHFSPRQEDV